MRMSRSSSVFARLQLLPGNIDSNGLIGTTNQSHGEAAMKPRIDYMKAAPEMMSAMLQLSGYLHKSELDENLVNLVCLRASQINGCAYCLDMHWKDLRVAGEQEQRLYGLDAWDESPYYSDRERAALEWTEAVTNLHHGHVPDETYDHVSKFFNEKEMADLTFAITMINAWNRLNIAGRTVPGSYKPGQFRESRRSAA